MDEKYRSLMEQKLDAYRKELEREYEDRVRRTVPSPSTQRFGRFAPDPSRPHDTKLVWRPYAEDDIDGLFERVDTYQESDDDDELYDFCILDRFIRQVMNGEPVEPWILHRVALGLEVLLIQGEPWELPFRIPFQKKSFSNRKLNRDMSIYMHVIDLLGIDGINQAEAFAMAADKFSVSDSTARNAYFYWNNKVEQNVNPQNKE